MTTPKNVRWLQVAERACEFRTLIGSGELAEAARRCDQSEQRLRASEAMSLQAQQAWRHHVSRPLFHATDDAQYRLFQTGLKECAQRHAVDAEHARQQVAEAQLSLRKSLAERDALHAAIERVNDLARVQQTQLIQREADEVWVIAQQSRGGPQHEDR